MSDFVIITDSSCDLPASVVEELGIHVVPLSFLMEDKSYYNYPDNRDMSPEEFYEKLLAGSMPTTNAVNVGQATEAMELYLDQGKDVLVLGFDSALSTTYNSFAIAADDIKRHYKDRKICVVDTLSASVGQGLLVWQAARMAKEGKSIEETRDWVEANKLHVCHWITVNDLFHLKRGGRVSAATAVMGSMLQIKPVLIVDEEGKLASVAKARGRKAALTTLVDQLEATAIAPQEQTVFVAHSACLEDARSVADQIKERCGVKDIVITNIGPVIGSHTGVGCVVACFLGTKR